MGSFSQPQYLHIVWVGLWGITETTNCATTEIYFEYIREIVSGVRLTISPILKTGSLTSLIFQLDLKVFQFGVVKIPFAS